MFAVLGIGTTPLGWVVDVNLCHYCKSRGRLFISNAEFWLMIEASSSLKPTFKFKT